MSSSNDKTKKKLRSREVVAEVITKKGSQTVRTINRIRIFPESLILAGQGRKLS